MQTTNSLVPAHRNVFISVIMLLTFALAACGFQLRGTADLAFKNVYIQGGKLSVTRDLERTLKTNGVQIAAKSEDAELLLELVSERSQKRIMSLSGGGLVREFELIYLLNFRIREASNPIWGPVQTIRNRRDFSYNDNALLGKVEEEERLNADMRQDAIREMLRRLTAIKPAAKQ